MARRLQPLTVGRLLIQFGGPMEEAVMLGRQSRHVFSYEDYPDRGVSLANNRLLLPGSLTGGYNPFST